MEKNPKDKKADEPLLIESLETPSTIVEPSQKNPAAQSVKDLAPEKGGAETVRDQPARKNGRFRLLPAWINIYLLMFLILVVVAALVTIISLKWRQDGKTSVTSKGQSSLSAQQLAELAANSTVIGDSKQTLDVQSNAVFEGQVLMRSDLNVAGNLKVGGPLALPALTVGGDSTLGQLQVNESLAVLGVTTLQGPLTIQKTLSVTGAASFTTVSASQLNVGNLQFSGDLTIGRHINPSGPLPTKINGSALGAGGTASVNGSDTAGTVTINTGGSPPAGCFITINFAQKFNTTPRLVISPASSSGALLDYYVNRTSSNFSVCTANSPAASTTYVFDYIAFD